ncbi:MAG: ABC transporter permease subunit [Thermoguttaceae bacterium]
MWTYLLRRLLVMIPTLFGVTIVSFCIMQLAPGDPLLAKAGNAGMTGQSSQTREAYLIEKRDLKLDKPLVLNFNYFRDYSDCVRLAAYYLARTDEQIAAELPEIAAAPSPPPLSRQGRGESLAQAIQSYVQVLCEDTGLHGVTAAIAMLHSPDSDPREKIGAIRGLNSMVPEPFVYTYTQHPTEAETAGVVSTWGIWWKRAEARFPPPDAERRRVLAEQFAALAAEPSRGKVLEGIEQFEQDDARFFAEILLGSSSLREKVVAAMALQHAVPNPLATDVARDAKPKLLARIAENWESWFDARQAQFEPGLARKCWYIVSDTQYAHMVWRLATFHFGRSTVRTHEPVSEKIWDAALVSAPLMLLSEVLIYLLAVPLGVVCAVHRNGWADRSISLVLFLLYSIPAFVAGMLFLLFFCYGVYWKWFPMRGLHAEGAEFFTWAGYAADYLWHIVLPVTCLSLFSLAGMAMYSRASMLDVISQDYIRTARSKGLSRGKVIYKHALRNALIPIITLFSSFLPAMLGGSVLVEYLFGIPGLGRLGWESIDLKDIPTLMALTYIEAILVMLGILLSDVLYVLVDPRITFQKQGQGG